MRKLVSVQRIDGLEPIENADFIEKAKVLGWTLVVKKGEFKVGDLCAYFEIDSILPDVPEFEFLNWADVYTLKCNNCPARTPVAARDKDNKIACPNCQSEDTEVVGGREIRKEKSRKLSTKKMRGVISQGLAMPLNTITEVRKRLDTELANSLDLSVYYEVGQDLTEWLQVTKYEPPINAGRAGNVKGNFPFYVPKTDETRIQSIPDILKEIQGKRCYISMKLDGTSSTYSFKDGEIDICSRNMSYKDGLTEGLTDRDDYYWAMAKRYNLSSVLKDRGQNIAVQGEICGPGIQKNRLGLPSLNLFVFDIYFIDEQRYASLEELKRMCLELGLITVPLIDENFVPDDSTTVESLLKMAEGKYPETKNEREGIVIRPVEPMQSEVLGGRLSFKVVSNRFLLKGGD